MSIYVTLAEAKTHLRVDYATDDVYIQALLDMIEDLVLMELQGEANENIAGKVNTYGTTSVVGVGTTFTDFAIGDILKVYNETSRIIDTITDDTHLATTIAMTNTASGLAYNVYTGLPQEMLDGSMPKSIKHAIKILTGHYYMLREPVMVGAPVTEVPFSFKYLINRFKNWTVT